MTPAAESPPGVTALMLDVFADLYRQEAAAEEDVHRTLPFFGTALGLVIGGLAYAAGRLPRWADLASLREHMAFAVVVALIGLAILEATFVLLFLSRAIADYAYARIGPESELRDRLIALQAAYTAQGQSLAEQDSALVQDIRRALLDTYMEITPANRAHNRKRTKFRAIAASCLIRSLIWALAATTVLFVADKIALLPKVTL